jgi:hypothetical protein
VGARLLLRPEEKKKQSSVWRVRDRYYERKIKKFQSSVWRVRDRYYDRKIKKVPVVCLAGARSQLRAEKKKIQSSVWRVRGNYRIDRGLSTS